MKAQIGLTAMGPRKVATIQFPGRPSNRTLKQVRSFDGRYWDPGFSRWIIPLPTFGAARQLLAWAVIHKYQIDPNLVRGVVQ